MGLGIAEQLPTIQESDVGLSEVDGILEAKVLGGKNACVSQWSKAALSDTPNKGTISGFYEDKT